MQFWVAAVAVVVVFWNAGFLNKAVKGVLRRRLAWEAISLLHRGRLGSTRNPLPSPTKGARWVTSPNYGCEGHWGSNRIA